MNSLFDIQVNGFAGVDFQQPDLSGSQIRRAVDGLASYETLRIFATLITDSVEALAEKFSNFERLRAEDPVVAEAICGYHLEGPWLSKEPGYRGAHDPQFMGAPSMSEFDRLQRAAGGNIRIVTLAPELPGSPEFIREATAQGIAVSIGHSNASDADIDVAIESGARFCTHLGNGVPSEMHRHENVTQRLLARDELKAFFIPDGIHLPPGILKNFFRAKPLGHALFTTDCMAAAGAPSGRYRLAHHDLEVGEDRVVCMPGSTQFAGSALEPNRGVVNVTRWLGIPPETARALFSTAVADYFGIALPFLNPKSP